MHKYNWDALRKINKERARKWVAALRSGECTQTIERLCDIDETGKPIGYCCLGVACEVARADGLELPVADDLESMRRKYAGEHSYLPPAVMEWLGLDTAEQANNLLMIDPDDETLAIEAVELNDGLQWSFSQIADHVEKFFNLNEKE